MIDLELDDGDADAARAELERACEQLLANPLIESYEIALERMSGEPRPTSRSSPSPARTTTGTRRSR